MASLLKHICALGQKLGFYSIPLDNGGNSAIILKSVEILPKEAKSFSGYRSQRVRNLYDPLATKPFKVSRSKLELFLKCARCFYLDRKLGVAQPPGYPFSLNNAVDTLLKKEFDRYRNEQKAHPICLENGIEFVPFSHPDIDRWRDSLHSGVQYIVPNTNIMLYGGLDDVWINLKTNELIVVDYKATSKATAVLPLMRIGKLGISVRQRSINGFYDKTVLPFLIPRTLFTVMLKLMAKILANNYVSMSHYFHMKAMTHGLKPL
jgi:hypothetical protein